MKAELPSFPAPRIGVSGLQSSHNAVWRLWTGTRRVGRECVHNALSEISRKRSGCRIGDRLGQGTCLRLRCVISSREGGLPIKPAGSSVELRQRRCVTVREGKA